MDMQLVTSLPSEVVHTQLARILASPQFCNAARLSRFLTYVVEQSIAGQSDRLKGYTIGLEVFDKDASFDPQTDTIVRVQARALRQKLDAYYLEDGIDDPVHIVIAKGGYDAKFYVPWDGERPTETHITPLNRVSNKPSVAILPFKHIGPKTGFEFLADGLTEGVISNLSRFKDLAVFSRSTTERAMRDRLSIAQMHHLFHPDFVLEGSFRINQHRVETRIKLISAATDEVVMTDSIDSAIDADDIYSMQDRLTVQIAAEIGLEYGPIGHHAQMVQRTGKSAKWDTYAWISRFYQYGLQLDQAGRDEIEAGLTAALSADPTSAEINAALAMIQIEHYRSMTADIGDPARLDQAIALAKRAVHLDPSNAMAHQAMALAWFHARRLVDFRASVTRALHLNPGHSDMLAMFGICFVNLAEWDTAISLLDQALALNPLHPDWYHMPKAIFLMMTDSPQAALGELEKRPMPEYFGFHFLLMWFHIEAGDLKAARVEKTRLLGTCPKAETFFRRFFDVVCLCDEIADRAVAAFRQVDFHVEG